jgi:hypothetical protein
MLSQDEKQVEEKEIVAQEQEHEDDGEDDDIVEEPAGVEGELKVDVETVTIYICRGHEEKEEEEKAQEEKGTAVGSPASWSIEDIHQWCLPGGRDPAL